MRAAAYVFAVLVGAPTLARADAAADAQVHVDRATLLYKEAKYADALTELNSAYALDPQPPLLYAMGQIEVKLGACDEAALYYKRFVDSNPGAGAAAATQEAIETCRAAHAPPTDGGSGAGPGPGSGASSGSGSGSAASPRTDPGQPAHVATWYDDHLADGLVAGGIAAEVIALILYADAKSDFDDAQQAKTYPSQLAGVDSAHTLRDVSVAFAVAGAVLAGVGAYHYVFLRDVEATGVMVAPTTGGAAVSWSTRF